MFLIPLARLMSVSLPCVLRAGTKYSVAVFGMFDGGISLPLAGEEKTTLSDDPEPPPVDPSGKNSHHCSLLAAIADTL